MVRLRSRQRLGTTLATRARAVRACLAGADRGLIAIDVCLCGIVKTWSSLTGLAARLDIVHVRVVSPFLRVCNIEWDV